MSSARLTQALERKLGRYLTQPELENVQQDGSSRKNELTEQELQAIRRVYPNFRQLSFKLEDRRVSSKIAGRGND